MRMRHIFLHLALLLLGVSTATPLHAADSKQKYEIYHQKLYGRENLQAKYQQIQKSYDKKELRQIFSRKNITCATQVISALDKLENEQMKFAVVFAHQNQWLDEVETDILMDFMLAYEDVSWNRPPRGFSLRTGNKIITKAFSELFPQSERESGCLYQRYDHFDEKMFSILNGGEHDELMHYLNLHALRMSYISDEQYRLAEMMRELKAQKSPALTMKEYHDKRDKLRSEGYDFNDAVTSFHIEKRSEGKDSLRTRVYSKFTPVQIQKMLRLLSRMNKRSGADSARISFTYENEIENIELSHTEKLRAGMKLYKREKSQLLEKSYFKGSDFSYGELITLSYEMGKIDRFDLNFLSELEKKTIEESFFEKVIDKAKRFNSIATLIGGPKTGFVYTLAVTLADRFINGPDKKKKASYQHGIFFGRCEPGL